MAALSASSVWAAGQITSATYQEPTHHYGHNVMGTDAEFAAMRVDLSDGRTFTVRFPKGTRIFEDINPRLWDVTGDAAPEIVVIETDPRLGAQLAIYGLNDTGQLTKLAATPHIGRSHRWLAPIGAADLDGDGAVEIAYIDRPHLAKQLRIWRYEDGAVTHVADRDGLTNHRIGWSDILGGISTCAGTPQMITVDANWQNIMVSQLKAGEITSQPIARYRSPDGLGNALRCE